MTDIQKCIEEELRYEFSSFSQTDAWNLGLELVKACSEMEGPLACEIELNGLVVFRYFPHGTEYYHEAWLLRKRNTVKMLGKSSLRVFYELEEASQDIERDLLLSKQEYADCGGGFPIRLKNGCLIGSIAVSGLSHLEDNFALVKGLDRFFINKNW